MGRRPAHAGGARAAQRDADANLRTPLRLRRRAAGGESELLIEGEPPLGRRRRLLALDSLQLLLRLAQRFSQLIRLGALLGELGSERRSPTSASEPEPQPWPSPPPS